MEILIAEDDAISRKLLKTVLQKEGHDVVAARDGTEAWEFLKRPSPPRLAVLDWMMPGHDGPELCRKIRERNELKGMYVILLTAKSEDDSIVDGLDAGADDYILKPFKRDELLARIAAGIRVIDLQSRLTDRTLELGRTLEELNLLMDHAEDFIYRIDDTGRCLTVSPSVERVLGIPATEWCKAPFASLTDNPSNEAFRKRDPGTADKAIYQIETAPAGGKTILLEIIERPCIEKGKRKGLVGVARDITQRIRTEEQLRESQKFDAIGRLAGGIAHEFNNLLVGIQMNAELLQDDLESDPAARESAENISKAVERGSNLTQHFMSFSQKQQLQPKEATLNEVVVNVTRIIRRILGEDIRIELDPGPDPWTVLIDGTVLEQAVINLALNARDAMPEGGTLKLTTGNASLPGECRGPAPALSEGDHAFIEIRDEGTGIPEEDLPRIFDPFFTTKEVGEGAGLGLSMVHGFTRQSGGDVTVESTPGTGTRFILYFPRVMKASPASSAEPVQAPGTIAGNGLTILLVEDDLTVRQVVRKLLDRNGFRILMAENGEQALEMERSFEDPIDLLLSDIVMPGLSGPELCTEIRRRRPDTACVFISGYPRDELIKRGKMTEVPAYISKPFKTGTLIRAIHEALS